MGDGNTLWSMLKLFLLKPLWRWCYTRFSPFHRRKLPAFTQAMALDDNRDVLTKTFQLAYDGLLKPVRHHHDNGGVAAAATTNNNGFYYPMTTDGVREAFRVQQSRHAKGKVVVRVST